ncbi:heptaprenyl diphosphate synthase component 1 [Numidum massiliense]|uniref:heptaprenyl diphosphate synthase component 1 n=1 Tax=Numidum massiliense TaxID=1522315 RepID=UPI0006D52CDF|nr:heptaprenyl diphosphate synthase component 1 [Numidum massiliense]
MTFLNGTYKSELETIAADIYDQANHFMFERVIGPPDIPQLSLALQYLYFKQHNYSQENIQAYCVSTILVQMGLEIHNRVSQEEAPAFSDENRERQMQVLAGDLYSGKFYRLLARHGAVRVIYFLSDAICHINQARANVYKLLQEVQVPLKQYLAEMERLSTSLFKAWLHNERSTFGAKWEVLATNLLTAESLSQEIERPSTKWPQSMLAQMKHKMQRMVANASHVLNEWHCADTKRELVHLIDVHFPNLAGWGRTAEEY